MKTKVDIERMAGQIDYEQVIKRLQNPPPDDKRKRTFGDLLEPLKPYLIEARQRKTSFVVLLNILRESGITISEPTLRQYLKGTAGKRKARKSGRGPIQQPAPKPELKRPINSTNESEQKRPRRTALTDL